MKRRARFTRSRIVPRHAFTLIELLVVIAIIAALMALTASAVIKYMAVQQNNNTQSTLDRTQSQLTKAWSKVRDAASKESIPASVTALAGTGQQARALYIQLRLRQAFPANFSEALNPSPLPPLPTYAVLANAGTPPANVQSSVCLLLALQRGVSGAGINPEDLTKGGATGSITTSTGVNLPYLTDAWGEAIYFTRGSNGLTPMLASSGSDRMPQFDPITFARTASGDDLFSTP